MGISLSWYKLKGITEEEFKKLLKDYKKEIDEINNTKLYESIDNLNVIDQNIISFKYQHDFVHSVTIRDELIKYPYFHKANFWGIFVEKNLFLLASGKNESVNFLIEKLKKLIIDLLREKENKLVDITVEKIKLTPDQLLEVTKKDAITITAQWFKKLGEREQTAFLSGNLEDEEGNQSDLYSLFLEKAEKSSSITFISEKLGYSLGVSQNKISSNVKEATYESFVNYFKELMIPIIKT